MEFHLDIRRLQLALVHLQRTLHDCKRLRVDGRHQQELRVELAEPVSKRATLVTITTQNHRTSANLRQNVIHNPLLVLRAQIDDLRSIQTARD